MLYTTFLLHWPFGKYPSLWFIRHIFFSFGRINGVSVDSLVGDEKTTLAAKELGSSFSKLCENPCVYGTTTKFEGGFCTLQQPLRNNLFNTVGITDEIIDTG